MHFVVVTPVLNGGSYIDEAILSVVGQAGAFKITYHVQDGGSTDGTLEKLQRWKELLASSFPLLCERLNFSYSSQSDKGVYDAVNKGFLACGVGDVMTWINSDDRIEPGTFSSVGRLLADHASIEWICGRGAIIDQSGSTMQMRRSRPYVRSCIRQGLYDGRLSTRMIMQEGTFWRTQLWEKVGGIDTSYRLAGDFDLWRRFAEHTDLVVADATFGYFRIREGQLSSDPDSYRLEIARRSPSHSKKPKRYDVIRERFGIAHFRRATRNFRENWQLSTYTVIRLGDQIEIPLIIREG